MVEGVLVGAFGGLGELGCRIGDGVLAKVSLLEAKSINMGCLMLILAVFLMKFVEDECEETMVV